MVLQISYSVNHHSYYSYHSYAISILVSRRRSRKKEKPAAVFEKTLAGLGTVPIEGTWSAPFAREDCYWFGARLADDLLVS